MRWCQRCVLPDTRPSLSIDPVTGVCNACRSHRTKGEIDWASRAAAFADVVAHARSRTDGYDCVVPVSGGKDSTWQVVTCLEHGLRVLAVTWRPPGRTDIGQRNLDNLISLGVDHIDYSIDPSVEARFARRTFEEVGSSAVPMHLALFNIPVTVATRFGIPLVVWGENSAFEYGSDDEARQGFELDEAWLRDFGVAHGTVAEDWIGAGLSARDLIAYRGPSASEVREAGVLAVFLGYYFAWDPERSRQVAAAHGFRARGEGAKTGLYDYADIDDDFISVHHHLKWLKFGFTRLFDNLSLEIRNGRIDRAEALDRIREHGTQEPTEDIERFCSFTGMSRGEFDDVCERFRNTDVWTQKDGTWVIEDFLLDDWDWS